MESVAAFITFYHVQGQRLADELFQARTKVKTFLEDIEKIDKELEELEKLWGGSSHAYDEKYVYFHYIVFIFCQRVAMKCDLGNNVVQVRGKLQKEHTNCD